MEDWKNGILEQIKRLRYPLLNSLFHSSNVPLFQYSLPPLLLAKIRKFTIARNRPSRFTLAF
jgi:hypothetical protein